MSPFNLFILFVLEAWVVSTFSILVRVLVNVKCIGRVIEAMFENPTNIQHLASTIDSAQDSLEVNSQIPTDNSSQTIASTPLNNWIRYRFAFDKRVSFSVLVVIAIGSGIILKVYGGAQ